jgi:hypothetical protein
MDKTKRFLEENHATQRHASARLNMRVARRNTTSVKLAEDVQKPKQGRVTFVSTACQLMCLFLAFWTVVIMHDALLGICFIGAVIGPDKAKEIIELVLKISNKS